MKQKRDISREKPFVVEKRIIYIDLDGVVADFEAAIRDHPLRITSPYDLQPDMIPLIFQNLETKPRAVEAVLNLMRDERLDIYFLSTAPWDNPSAWTDKRIWVERIFGENMKKRLILTHRKDLRRGDILIDDRPNNGAERFEGEWIQFGTEECPDWDHALARVWDIDPEEYKQIQKDLEEMEQERIRLVLLRGKHRQKFEMAKAHVVEEAERSLSKKTAQLKADLEKRKAASYIKAREDEKAASTDQTEPVSSEPQQDQAESMHPMPPGKDDERINIKQEIELLEKELKKLSEQKKAHIERGNYELAAQVRDRELAIKLKIAVLLPH